MKKEKKTIKNGHDNKTVETIVTTPEDGFVHEADIHSVGLDSYGKYHKGYSTHMSFTIDDPKFKKKIWILLCVPFFVTGFSMLIVSLFIGIPIIIFSLWLLYTGFSDIKRVETEQKEKSNNEQDIISNVLAVENNYNERWKNFFSKKNYKWFLKTAIPFGCIIVLASTILISIAFDMFFGMIWFVLCCLILILYFWIFFKIFKN